MATAKTVKDVSPHEFVKAYAAHLKRSGKIELPPWVDIVKTGVLKELAPYDPDWYYIRAASMARKIYLRQGLGVGAFRRIYGGSKSNGSRPSHFGKSSGSVARHILQQLQANNIIDIDPKGGRKITSNGQRDLDQVAGVGSMARFQLYPMPGKAPQCSVSIGSYFSSKYRVGVSAELGNVSLMRKIYSLGKLF